MEFLQEVFYECFNTQGRMNRKRYFFYPIILGICLFFPVFVLYMIISYYFGSEMADILYIFILLFLFVLFYVQILSSIKRCRDVGYSGWMSLILYVPYAGLIFQIYLLLTKGTEGPNQYGPDRLQEKPVQKLQPTEDQVL